VEHWLNGEKVLEYELGPEIRRLAETNKVRVFTYFGLKNTTRLCILDQGNEISFRDLKIRPIFPAGAPGQQATGQPGQTNPNPFLIPRNGATGANR
jgi:hypothetical protein